MLGLGEVDVFLLRLTVVLFLLVQCKALVWNGGANPGTLGGLAELAGVANRVLTRVPPRGGG